MAGDCFRPRVSMAYGTNYIDIYILALSTINVNTGTDVITKIKNTFHTAGINSSSMYRDLTQPVDGIPEHTQR